MAAFKKLNAELKGDGSKAEVCIVGGAVMCLVFNAREQTKDVDAIFHPNQKSTNWQNESLKNKVFLTIG